MHIRRAEACDHGRIGSILASAYEPVMQRMQPEEASEFAARLPDVVSRYAKTGVWLLAEQNESVGTVIEARSFYESLGFAVLKELPPVWGAPTFLYALKTPVAP